MGDGGDITVADFYKTAKEICATPNTDQPFMCLDVSYMAVLLEEGYGLKPQTKIKVRISSNCLSFGHNMFKSTFDTFECEIFASKYCFEWSSYKQKLTDSVASILKLLRL